MNRSAVITVDPLVALGEETVEQDHSHGAFSAVIRTASPKSTLLNGTSVKFVACAEALDPDCVCRDLAMGRRSHEPIENVDRDSHYLNIENVDRDSHYLNIVNVDRDCHDPVNRGNRDLAMGRRSHEPTVDVVR